MAGIFNTEFQSIIKPKNLENTSSELIGDTSKTISPTVSALKSVKPLRNSEDTKEITIEVTTSTTAKTTCGISVNLKEFIPKKNVFFITDNYNPEINYKNKVDYKNMIYRRGGFIRKISTLVTKPLDPISDYSNVAKEKELILVFNFHKYRINIQNQAENNLKSGKCKHNTDHRMLPLPKLDKCLEIIGLKM